MAVYWFSFGVFLKIGKNGESFKAMISIFFLFIYQYFKVWLCIAKNLLMAFRRTEFIMMNQYIARTLLQRFLLVYLFYVDGGIFKAIILLQWRNLHLQEHIFSNDDSSIPCNSLHYFVVCFRWQCKTKCIYFHAEQQTEAAIKFEYFDLFSDPRVSAETPILLWRGDHRAPGSTVLEPGGCTRNVIVN